MPTLIPSSEDVRVYEVAVMIDPTLPGDEESATLKEIDETLSEAGVKMLFKDPWTKRGLAYPVNGHTEAKFLIYYFEIDPLKIREIDGALRLQRGVMRHMVIIPPKGYEAVSHEDRYQQWLKTRETMTEKRAREKEEKVKQSVVAQARRETKKLQQAKPKEKTPAVKIQDLDRQIDKLISDSDLGL